MSGTDELIRGLAERIVERRLQHSGFLAVNIGDAERVESVLRESGLEEVFDAMADITEAHRSLLDSDYATHLNPKPWVTDEAWQRSVQSIVDLRSKVVPR